MTAVTTIAGGLGPYVNTHVILGQSGAGVSLTGTASETVLATVAVPAGYMGLNGVIRIRTLWTFTNNANNKTRRIRFGLSGAGTGGSVILGFASASQASHQHFNQIQNRNATNSQVAATSGASTGGWAESTSGVNTTTIDTTQACELAITGQLANSSDTMILESYFVELFRS